jgi:uncharacterized protein
VNRQPAAIISKVLLFIIQFLGVPMFKKTIAKTILNTIVSGALVALCGISGLAHAQTAVNSAAKNELVTKILQLQRPAIEGIATALAQQPAQQMMQGASVALQSRIAPDKREAVAKEIQADLKKYVDEVVPLLREKAVKMAPTTIGTLLEEKFTEDELRKLIEIMESPVNKKFSQMNGELQKSLGEKLVADTRSIVEPKVKALDATIGKRLGMTPPPAPGPGPTSSGAAPAPAKPASGK